MSQYAAHNDDKATGSQLLFDSCPGVIDPTGPTTRGQAQPGNTPTLANQQAAARRQIQGMALDFVRAMATFNPSQPPLLPLAPRPVAFRVGDLESEHDDSPFPSIRSLAQTVKVMQIIHDQLTSPIPAPAPTQAPLTQEVQEPTQSKRAGDGAQRPLFVTRRDLYYRDPELFKSQRTVDTIVNSLSLTVHPLAHSHELTVANDLQSSTLLDASHLGVVASSRGVALGSCRIHLLPTTTNSSESTIVDLGPAGSAGVLLPPGAQIQRVELDPAVSWVLIVEKDATFQTLAQHDFPRTCSPPGLIVTSRGFPDVATRQFLRLLPDVVRMYTLVDADPFGVHIHWMYQQAMIGRAATHLGVHLEDLIHEEGGQDKVMPLVDGDVKRIQFLLGNEDVKREAGIRRTLQIMLHMRVKAEIQALGGQLLPYLYQRLQIQPIQSQRAAIGAPAAV